MRILYKDTDQTLFTDHFDAPEVKPGDRIVYKVPCETLKGERYDVGDCLCIINRTNEAPHKRITTSGNWLVKGKDGELTIWSNIELMLSKGWAVIDNSHIPQFSTFGGPLRLRA